MNSQRSFNGEVLVLLILLGLGGVWYFGRGYALEPRMTQKMVTCEACGGGGLIKCPDCGGFGTVEVLVPCKACGGTGRHRWRITRGPEAPCPKCFGTGKVAERVACPACEEKGTRTCTSCHGEGALLVDSLKADAVFMHPSLWERGLGLLGFSVPSNPCPQRLRDGSYPVVESYLELRASGKNVQVRDWGRFVQDEGAWKMVALIAFERSDGTAGQKWVEFVAKDRLLSQCLLIRRPQDAD